MSEYIGSRISLISKSDIRYVGTLKAIDSDTATVSLEGVTCHGSEGRKGNPDLEVPGTDAVYEGIVFRGSDVKDLTILSPPQENKPPQMPNDPAILGSSQSAPAPPQPQAPQQPPPNQYRGPPPPHQQNRFGYQGPPPPQFQQQPRFQGPGGPHGFPGSPGAVPGYGMGYGGPPPGYGMGMGYGGPPPPPGQGFPQHPHGAFPPQHQMPIGTPGAQINPQRPPPPPQQQPQQQAPIGSKQGTPQPAATQGPQPPQAKSAEAVEMPGAPAEAPTGPPPPLESKPSTSAAVAPASAPQPPQSAATKAAQKANARVAVPLPAPNADANRARPKPAAAQQAPVVAAMPQPPSTANATDAATAAVAAAMAKLGAINQAPGAVDNLAQKVNQMRMQDGQTRGRGRGRGTSTRGGRRESTQKTVDVPKEDYDFESANAKFNKQELVKEAIATGSPVPGADTLSTASESATAASLPPTNGHDAYADDGDDDVVVPAKSAAERGYDKKSSFFDNISSDLRDRVEQQRGGGEQIDGRSMRREERTKNVETFGQGSIDGGYRGRGRGRGRGFGRGRGYFGGRGGMRGRGRGGAEAAPI